MLSIYFLAILFVVSNAKPSIETPPPLAFVNIIPDDFLRFFFSIGASERQIIEDTFLEHADKLNDDEKTKLFVDKIRQNDPKLGERLHKVIQTLSFKKEKLSKPVRDLFDLFMIKPNVPKNSARELKTLTQLRLRKWVNLGKEDKADLKKLFPDITSFFETLISDKQILEFADFRA